MRSRDRDSFSSSGGYWTRPDHTGRARSIAEARNRATYDHQPKRGILARLLTRGNRR